MHKHKFKHNLFKQPLNMQQSQYYLKRFTISVLAVFSMAILLGALGVLPANFSNAWPLSGNNIHQNVISAPHKSNPLLQLSLGFDNPTPADPSTNLSTNIGQNILASAAASNAQQLTKTLIEKNLNNYQSQKQQHQASATSIFIYPPQNVHKTRLTDREREVIIAAIKDIDANNWKDGQDKIASLQSAFASQLFNWMWLVYYDRKDPDFTQAAEFLTSVPDWPDQFTIRRRIETVLNKDLKSGQIHDQQRSYIITWFDQNPPLTPDGMRVYLNQLHKNGQDHDAQIIFREFWAKTTLSRADQQYFYRHYKHWMNDDTNRRRLDYLLYAGQYTNARNLAQIMGSDYQKLIEARIALAEKKTGVDWYIRQVPSHLEKDPGLLYERLKWRRQKNLNASAIDILNFPPDANTIANPKDWWRERLIIAQRMIEKKSYKTAYSLVANHRQLPGSFSYAQAEWMSGWMALEYTNKPVFAFEHFQNIYKNVQSPISRSRGAYWSGRAQEKLGQYTNAAQWYKTASRHGATFYGQLANVQMDNLIADHANYKDQIKKSLKRNDISEPVSYDLNYPPIKTSFEAQRAFQAHNMVLASQILKMAGRDDDAAAFIDAMGRMAISPMDYQMIADFSIAQSLPHKALHIAKKASYKSIVLPDHQFPLVYNIVEGIDNVEWALIHGIMRQESAFNPQARSPVGARGMMQLMPATARALARKYHIKHNTNMLTNNPHHNVRLGALYLHDLLDRYDQSYVLAIAAYNAGPGRVNRWLKTYGDPRIDKNINWINWIELIPIYETRNYVQRVLESVYVYRNVFAHNKSSSGQDFQSTAQGSASNNIIDNFNLSANQ